MLYILYQPSGTERQIKVTTSNYNLQQKHDVVCSVTNRSLLTQYLIDQFHHYISISYESILFSTCTRVVTNKIYRRGLGRYLVILVVSAL